MKRSRRESAERLELCGVVENVEDVGMFSEESCRAAVEMEGLGETAEEVNGDGGRGRG